MSGSVNLFNIGKSGLFASRSGLSTTGHNISNVNTEGYSRQRVELETAQPQVKGNAVYGSGVRIRQVERINDEFLDRQISNEIKYIGEYTEKEAALSQAENIFNEIDNAGLNRLVAKFFNEFRKLGNEPESEALRATVRESAAQLTGDFHRISRSIQDIQRNVDTRIEANVRQVNEIVDRLVALNQEIRKMELSGGSAPDLKDKRDLAVRKLSELVDISVSVNEKNDYTVALSGIGPLLSGTLSNKLELEPAKSDPESGIPDRSLRVKLHGLGDITDRLKKSRLGGLIDSRDRVLASALQRTNELAYHLASKVNELHSQGFTLDGDTGIDFFKQPDSLFRAAEFISLSDDVKRDVNKIASALVPDAPGDNRIAQLIARLQHQKLMRGGNATFDDFYNATVAEVATESQKTKGLLEHQTHIVGQLDKFRESISGVSLDEETTNLIQFQHAFDASAKVIKVADELLETVLNLKR